MAGRRNLATYNMRDLGWFGRVCSAARAPLGEGARRGAGPLSTVIYGGFRGRDATVCGDLWWSVRDRALLGSVRVRQLSPAWAPAFAGVSGLEGARLSTRALTRRPRGVVSGPFSGVSRLRG
jgi:hypothetical protein